MFLVIGSTTLDLIQGGITQMPSPRGDEFTVESLVFCDDPLQMRFGGNGANSAYTLAKLGAHVALGSAIGMDSAGDLLYRPLAAMGVDLRGLLRHPSAATSVTTVISDQKRNRFAFHHAGSSHVYAPTDLPDTLRTQTTALLINSYTLFPAWRPAGVATLLQQVKARGGITALDIGPAIGQPATLDEIAPFLPAVDYFLCNQHELAVCIGATNDTADDTADDTNEALLHGMQRLLAAGVGTLVIKRGAAGAWLQRSSDPAPIPVAGFPVNGQDTVGAGDSFDGGFLYAVTQGEDAITSVRIANGIAALVIQSRQGVFGAPTYEQANHYANSECPTK